MDAVAQTVLDTAWSRTPPAVMNVVHPRPVAWNTLFAAVNDVVLAEGLLTEKLPFVDFRMWVTRLEEAAADATPETLENIVSCFFLRSSYDSLFYAACHQAPRLFPKRGGRKRECHRWGRGGRAANISDERGSGGQRDATIAVKRR